MAKGKSTSKAAVNGQKSITSFFGGGNGKQQDSSSDIEVASSAQKSAPDASDLPPIHDIPAMFSDLVGRVPEIKDVAVHVKGRKLRVATMCSGTESPLLALELIQKCISEQHGINLDVEHVFSCEIEPFKQAYIERNFHPPLLFRDVCELGDGQATTAYGALAPVPGDVDLLVAGTSCVDYSNLNNEKQSIDGNGESGRTFRGMMSWVQTHRPPIVILENVCSAPWDRVKEYFVKQGYSASYSRVDTKQFYIPHTRTRVYLVAVNKKKSSIPDNWVDMVLRKLKRPASSTLDAFLLPSDDPRIHQSRQKLVQESYNALDRRTGRTDWGRCESRHQRARLEEGLGSKRPLTGWDEGGFCKLPDFAWNDWGVGQVERVWDLMDITLLRSALNGVDPSYKTQVWNLSQNVDRTIGSSKAGICPCLTPSMIPYITNRGGPMVGLEALSMQGLPVNKLLLTRETEDQLADLAGNAMSTTVVGACILAALVTGRRLLKAGDDEESYETKNFSDANDVRAEEMDVDRPLEEAAVSVEDRIVGEDQLIQRPLDLSVSGTHSLHELLAQAEKSARLCECEGRKDITDRQLRRCVDCGSSSCKKCGGRPEHNMEVIDVAANPRLLPSVFARDLKSILPMCLTATGITQRLLDGLKSDGDVSISRKTWLSWRAAVLRAAEYELRFVEPKRQEIWSAVYRSPTASLELSLHPQQPEWRLYAVPEEDEPASSEIRQLLRMPVARFTCVGGLLEGRWEFALPHSTEVAVTIEGVGELVPAWESKLGLIKDDFVDRKVYPQVKISVPNDDLSRFDRDISGTYTLLDKCGTANSALHKKVAGPGEGRLPPLFMLLDPSRCGDSSDDSFVFSISKRRYEFGESRPIVCRLDPSWRQSSEESTQDVACYIPYKWVEAEEVELGPSQGQEARFSVPGEVLDIAVSNTACRSANALLVCEVDLRSQAGPEWPRENWQEVDKIHERETYRSLGFLTERIRNIDDHFSSWQTVELPEDHSNCERCAPTVPTLKWVKLKNKMTAMEDPIQAGDYERRLKRRPAPFVTQLRLDDKGLGHVRIGINIPSLLHRAFSRLPSAGRTGTPTLSWRLNTDFTPAAKLNLPKFRLKSNKFDLEHAQPPSFKTPLRKEQLRSLEWMLKQESRDAVPFVEEEISEAILEPLGWRAEGRAQRPVHIRGGVLADQVGYGKTAITLGLIDCTSEDVDNEFSKMEDLKGKIPVKASLIIVPPHLTRQWDSEVRKFAGKRFKTVVLSTATNLNPLTIEAVQEADMVIVASNLFHSSVYLANLEAFAAGGALPAQDGRYFNARLDSTLESLRGQVDRLRDDGSVAVMKEIHAGRARDDEAEAKAFVQTKRLKGKSYRDAADAAATKEAKPIRPKPRSPSGLKMEVVILVPSGRKVSKASAKSEASSATEAAGDDDEDSDAPRQPRKPRAAAKKTAFIISDDEDDTAADASSDYNDDDDVEEAPAPKKSTSAKGRSKPTGPPSSDYGDESAEETADDESSAEETDDASEDEKPSRKAKSKPKAKAAPKKRSSASSANSEAEDSMDVDEPRSKPKKPTKKRKADEDEDRPAKKQKRREESDPWKLNSRAVQKDWAQMQAPPLEMFHFARKVVDEYTYLEGKIHSMVTNLTAERHWVLSGTPPIHDFAALKTIAAFLDLHLGVDDDGEGQSVQVKKRRREQTLVEKFHSFREVHSLEWHAHRHQLGQSFLDRFVRQNIAEIDEIPCTEKIEKIDLPAAERAIYLELEHHLRALDMTIKRGKKTESDREKRLAKSLGESKSAEEALLKRCSHFDLDASDKENAMKACEVIVKERTKQLDECKAELLKELQKATKVEKKLGKMEDESMFGEYIRVQRKEGAGDSEATKIVNALLDEAGAPAPLKTVTNRQNDAKSGAKNKSKSRDDAAVDKKTKDLMWEHREHAHDIRRLTKELVGRVRSLRYFTVVRDLQKQRDVAPLVVDCPKCDRKAIPTDEVAVLSSCGHTGCLNCVKACAEKEECVYAADRACNAAARVLNVVKGDTLGVDDEARDGRGKHFGLKLEKVIELIKKRLPPKDRVLVFVQFPDLMKKVAEALTANRIAFLEIRGTAAQKSKNLEKFQNDSEERVLLLNVMDESASGANLTSASHAVFLSPLLAPAQEIYDACETQAIGRLRRYGQTKHVYVWRFLSTNTIDAVIYEDRTKGHHVPDTEEMEIPDVTMVVE